MSDYVAMRWRVADVGATQLADRVTPRLEQQAWCRAIDAPGWRVMLGPHQWAASLRSYAQDTLVVIGTLFDRGSTANGQSPEPPFNPVSTRFGEVAQTLSKHSWGAYVALGIDETDPDRLSLFRDPIGALDCATWCAGGVRFVSSDPGSILTLARPPDLAIDWTRVANLLAYPASVADDLPMTGLHAVPAGWLVECREARIEQHRLWHPASFCSPHREAMQDSAARLETLVDDCVAAWCSQIHNGAAELSGGLDSAIVAAAAAKATPRSVQRWFHYSSDDIAGDERAFAHAVATHLAIPLTSIVRADRQIDPAAIAAMPTPVRPGLGSASLFHDRDLAARLDALGADALLTGHGGDAVFFQPATPLVAGDLLLSGRSLVEGLSAVEDIARWTRSSIWKVAGVALRARMRSSAFPIPAPTHSFLGPAGDGARHQSPWLDGIAHLAPAKQLQIWMIANCRSAFGASCCSRGRRMIHPLLSQPLVEHALGIAAIDLTVGRRERGLARAAYAHRLPAKLLDRRGKGDLTLYLGRMLAGSTDTLREYLLDGMLAANNAIDRVALEAILTPEILIQHDHVSELMTTIILEHWARSWTARLDHPDDQRACALPQPVASGSK